MHKILTRPLNISLLCLLLVIFVVPVGNFVYEHHFPLLYAEIYGFILVILNLRGMCLHKNWLMKIFHLAVALYFILSLLAYVLMCISPDPSYCTIESILSPQDF